MTTKTEAPLRNVVLIDTTDAEWVLLGDYDYVSVSTEGWTQVDWAVFSRAKRDDRIAVARKIAAKYEEVK